ncbi:MAG: hypothetical protein R3E72_06605 [Steroidobacteraceae bacterium]
MMTFIDSSVVKERWGKLIDDERDVIGGKRDQLAGRIQQFQFTVLVSAGWKGSRLVDAIEWHMPTHRNRSDTAE